MKLMKPPKKPARNPLLFQHLQSQRYSSWEAVSTSRGVIAPSRGVELPAESAFSIRSEENLQSETGIGSLPLTGRSLYTKTGRALRQDACTKGARRMTTQPRNGQQPGSRRGFTLMNCGGDGDYRHAHRSAPARVQQRVKRPGRRNASTICTTLCWRCTTTKTAIASSRRAWFAPGLACETPLPLCFLSRLSCQSKPGRTTAATGGGQHLECQRLVGLAFRDSRSNRPRHFADSIRACREVLSGLCQCGSSPTCVLWRP